MKAKIRKLVTFLEETRREIKEGFERRVKLVFE